MQNEKAQVYLMVDRSWSPRHKVPEHRYHRKEATDLGQQMPSKTHLSMVIQVLECTSVLDRYKGIGTYLLAAVPPSETSSTYKKLHNPSS